MTTPEPTPPPSDVPDRLTEDEWLRWDRDPDEWPHTPPYHVFAALMDEDDNTWWRAGSGHGLNAYEDARERVDELEARLAARDAEWAGRLARAWDDGYNDAATMARCYGHTDHWEDEPSNPYTQFPYTQLPYTQLAATEPGTAAERPGSSDWHDPEQRAAAGMGRDHDRMILERAEQGIDGRVVVVRCPHTVGLTIDTGEYLAFLPCPCNDRSEVVAVVVPSPSAAAAPDEAERGARRSPGCGLRHPSARSRPQRSPETVRHPSRTPRGRRVARHVAGRARLRRPPRRHVRADRGHRREGGRAVSAGKRRRCYCGVYTDCHQRGEHRPHRAPALWLWFRDHSVWQHLAAPLWVRVPERWRWRIVDWLNRSQRRCWANLVDDALTHREDDACDTHVPELRPGKPRCADTCDWSHLSHTGEHACSCYCGKFQFTAPDGAIERKAATR